MKNTTVGLIFGLIFAIESQSQPIEIEGEGDVSSNYGRSCSLEDFRSVPMPESCARSSGAGNYIDTYTATPRDGWQFDGWRNYCEDAADNTCAFNVPAETVEYTLFDTVTPLVAVFVPVAEAGNAQSSEAPPVIAATGQTRCFNVGGSEISCSGTGQDGDIQAGVQIPNPRFTDRGDGTVRDNLTGLIWLKRGKCLSTNNKVSWLEAMSLAANLADGHSACQLSDGSKAGDWRLPNVRELMSFIDVGTIRTGGDAITPGHPFTNVKQEMHWTSTSRADDEHKVWTGSFFYSGRFSSAEKATDKWWVWAMRTDAQTQNAPLSLLATNQTRCFDVNGSVISCAGTGQDGEIQAGVPAPAQRFTDNGDGTVLDNLTGLIWVKKANCMAPKDFADMLEDVAALADGNSSCNLSDGSQAGDWRMPNYHEFLSLHDLSRFEPQLSDGHPFTNIQNELYWTSTTPARSTDSGFMMNTYWRNLHSGGKEAEKRTWPVRNALAEDNDGPVDEDEPDDNDGPVIDDEPDNDDEPINDDQPDNDEGPKAEQGVVAGVNSATWRRVTLENSYENMVVVATPNYSSDTNPGVVRIRNASGSSFEMKIGLASEGLVTGVSVHYLVVEEGVYESPRMEARLIESADTNRKSKWGLSRMVELDYAHAYVKPVVVGQVMTHNDAGFSAFWSRRNSKRQLQPSAKSGYVGKHVAEDPTKTRVAETLGVIVIESGSGELGGIPYTAGIGPATAEGMDNAPGFTYPVGDVVSPYAAILSSGGMKGANGGWPVLYGDFPVTSNGVEVVVDEDTLGDSERKHGGEKFTYIIMGAP
ncbi:MAG: DUF1566 domain-containing protein [Pseudomonadota bacterium]